MKANGELNAKYLGSIEAQKEILENEGSRLFKKVGKILGITLRIMKMCCIHCKQWEDIMKTCLYLSIALKSISKTTKIEKASFARQIFAAKEVFLCADAEEIFCHNGEYLTINRKYSNTSRN